MASISRDPNGRKRILFKADDGTRKPIRLGKMSLRKAEKIKERIEDILAGRRLGRIDPETASWIASLPDDVHGKLAAVGLVEERISTALGPFLDNYLESRNLKPGSLKVYDHTRHNLTDFFGPHKPIREISEEDAEAWRHYLGTEASRKKKPLSVATVNKRCQNAKVFFNVAVERKLTASNPFSKLDSKSVANKARQYFVNRHDAEKVLEACPDAQWRLIFALCRYGGLRCPSEILALKFEDIDWQQRRLLVYSPKTERYEGRESRIIPIFPEILPHLQEVFDTAEPGTTWVITRYRRPNVNLRTQFQRILRRASVKPWPRLFQNLRATRETELAAKYPLHVATAWIGNTARIAERHYLQVPDEFYDRASRASRESDTPEKETAQNAAQYLHASGRNEPQDTDRQGGETGVFLPVTAAYDSVQKTGMEAGGFEGMEAGGFETQKRC
ncbi:MAG: tyrosine-type recombinase/integrase [Planctomycetota bacterium]|jgi:integrase